ncbi:MAG: FtsX-like permease family protein [Acidobacteria bacterium]|nr:FtsX-like permease family protein [Acidobacteriota bacterium]
MGIHWHDVKYALRSLLRQPAHTAVLLATLALGIGSNVAIFSVVDAVLVQPLPYDDPEQLALIWNRIPGTSVERGLVSGPDFADYRAETSSFEELAGAAALAGTITGDGPAEQINAGYATGNLFDMIGVTPALGRNLKPEDEFVVDPQQFGQPGAELPPGTVMISYGLWQRRYGGSLDVIGKSVELDGWGSTIAGVLPADFRIYMPEGTAMPPSVDAWGVLPSNISDFARTTPWITVVARLRDGATITGAQGEFDALGARLIELHPFHANQNTEILVRGLHQEVVAHTRVGLYALLGSVLFVLAIACANVANLLLVRGADREREIAVRSALGSGRGRIVKQLLTESLVLSSLGAALGILLAWWGQRAIVALAPSNLPRIENAGLDLRVLGFTILLTTITALAFGLVPALRAARTDPGMSLRDRGTVSGGLKSNKLRAALVIGEVALSMALLIGAGLMLRSFAELQQVRPGFEPEQVLTFSAPISFFPYIDDASRAAVMTEITDRIGELGGVAEVGAIGPLPLDGTEQFHVGSYGLVTSTTEEYQANKADSAPVAVIDRNMADRLFGGQDPLGQEIAVDYLDLTTFAPETRLSRVVGVVDNVRGSSLASDSRETIYQPYILASWRPMTFVVKTAAASAALVPRIREVVTAIDADIPVAAVASLESFVDQARAPTRFMLALIGAFAALALLLAAFGLYGVISYSVQQREREIGVRVAFGASSKSVVGLMLREGTFVAVAGIVTGVVASVFLSRVVASLLVGVSATDPITYVSVPLVLFAVSCLATYLPARRAARIDPVEAIRGD